MMRFRKKPIVIDAIKWDGHNLREIVEWSEGCARSAKPHKDFYDWLAIETLEGIMEAYVGDWIIRGIKGEFYPCKPDIFEATYEPVTDSEG